MLMLNAVVLLVAIAVVGCSNSSERSSANASNAASRRESVGNQKAPVAPAASFEFHGPREVILNGRIAVAVMEMMAPPRAAELFARLQEAVRQDPEWWFAHVKTAKPGESLPYDSRLGLSTAEYDEFLALSKHLTMQKKSDATLTITAQESDVFVLNGGDDLSDLTGITIDLNSDLVHTPFGIASERSEIDATDESPLGAWSGVQWKLEEPDPNGITGTVVKLAVGRLKRSGRGVIYYDVKAIGPDAKTRISYVLEYDLPSRQ